MQPVETQDFGFGIVGKIYQDDDLINPREDFEQLGAMVCWHRRYNLGDKHKFQDSLDFQAEVTDKNAVILPLYLYDHSGITISTKPFSCRWDSGQVGWIYVSIKKIKKEYGWKVLTKARRLKIEEYLRGEVEVYDQYLTGDVWGYVIEDSEGEELDACWGFYGLGHVRGEMAERAGCLVQKVREQLAQEIWEEVGDMSSLMA